MKRTYIAAALLTCAAAPAVAADYYYVYPSGATVAAPVASPPPSQVVVYQDRGTISLAQQRLAAAGYNVAINGALDSSTVAALKDFQLRQGIASSGMIDQPTLSALGIGTSMSGNVGGAPVIISEPTPVIVAQPTHVVVSPAPASRAPMPVNYEGTPGNNLGTSMGENHIDSQWSANYQHGR